MLKIPYLVNGKAGAPALNADIFQPNCRRQKSRNRKEILVQLGEVVGGGGQGDREANNIVVYPAPCSPLSSFLQIPADFFLQQHQRSPKRKTKQSKLQDGEKTHFHVNVTILPQNKHSRNNETLVWIHDAEDEHK